MIYKTSLGLMTDLYQLTMAYGYWKSGMSNRRATFNLFFRSAPFRNGFAVACGLKPVIDLIETLKGGWFSSDDCEYLSTLTGYDGKALFDNGFVEYLRGLKFDCSVQAVPEGTVIYAHEPLLSITGSLDQCQLLETPLLNLINFNTLIATKANRVCRAAGKDVVLDFGLRRAQGFDGALSASRACYIGGCSGTSNVLAGKLFGIPVKGTHAHSWIMSFDTELEAMTKYVEAMPNNSVLLVDTYNTVAGIISAIEAGRVLRSMGYDLAGIRLDSGNLCELSKLARQILDASGFKNTMIVASNDLDEDEITTLKQGGAKINAWGVGTRMVTAYDQPALGGVYKLAALEDSDGKSVPKIKLSENIIKTTIPGAQQVLRINIPKFGKLIPHDIIYDVSRGVCGEARPLDTHDYDDVATFNSADGTNLLVPIYDSGSLIYKLPDINDVRNEVLKIDYEACKNPNVYLDLKLFDIKNKLIAERK